MDPVFDDLLDLDNGTISGAIFTDEEIYQEELGHPEPASPAATCRRLPPAIHG